MWARRGVGRGLGGRLQEDLRRFGAKDVDGRPPADGRVDTRKRQLRTCEATQTHQEPRCTHFFLFIFWSAALILHSIGALPNPQTVGILSSTEVQTGRGEVAFFPIMQYDSKQEQEQEQERGKRHSSAPV